MTIRIHLKNSRIEIQEKNKQETEKPTIHTTLIMIYND